MTTRNPVAVINSLKTKLEVVEQMIKDRKGLGYKMVEVKGKIWLALHSTVDTAEGSEEYSKARRSLELGAEKRSWHALENYFIEALGRLELALDQAMAKQEEEALSQMPQVTSVSEFVAVANAAGLMTQTTAIGVKAGEYQCHTESPFGQQYDVPKVFKAGVWINEAAVLAEDEEEVVEVEQEAVCLTGALTTAATAVSYKLDIDGHTERNEYSAEMIEEMVEKVDHIIFHEVFGEVFHDEQTGWEYYGFNAEPSVSDLLAGLMDKVEAKRLLNLRMIRAGVREVAEDMNMVEPEVEVEQETSSIQVGKSFRDNRTGEVVGYLESVTDGKAVACHVGQSEQVSIPVEFAVPFEWESELEQEVELEQAVEATTYIEERDVVEMELMEADIAEMEQGVVSPQKQQVETPVTVEPVVETPETPEKQLPSYYVEVVVGSLWYYIAYTAALGFYWSPDKKDAHSFTYEGAKEYQRNDTNCGQTFIQVLDDGEAVEVVSVASVPEPETRGESLETPLETVVELVETPLETVDTASDSQLHLIPIKCAVWELTSMAYDKKNTHKDMLNRIQWHRYDFRELGGAVEKLWDELIDKVYNASRRCRAVAIMAKYQVLLQSELETMGVSWTPASSGMEA